MNKQQAADFLGVSVRALERYVQQGRVSVRYEKGKTRPTAQFDQAELEAFKEELNQPSYKGAVESRQITTTNHDQKDKSGHYPGEIVEFGEQPTVIDRLSAIIETMLARRENEPTVPIEAKLLLTLAEAQALTGLPRQVLRDAITEGKLKAKVIGRGWRIKRSDLEEFVDKLF